MEIQKKKISTFLFLLIGGLLLSGSEFIPWVSNQYSAWYFFYELVIPVNNRYLYIFPLVTGVGVILIATIVLFSRQFSKGLVSMLIFVVISLLLVYLIELVSEHGDFLFNSPGIFMGIFGFCIVFLGLITYLGQNPNESNPDETNESHLLNNSIEPDKSSEKFN
ncbi:MAG: hypothetical protein GF364_17880 [Candidatus Lokiarchaeota archaeon]|nr:hypothetical protein [Candidatus Lokiarchaeota archaeon]